MLPISIVYPALMLFLTMMFFLSFIMFWPNMKSLKSETKKKAEIKKISLLSLFISFDQNISLPIFMKELNWVILLMLWLVMYLSYWNFSSRISMIVNSLINYISKQFEIGLKTKKDSSKLIFLSIFLIIMLSNLFGLIPNSFTPTSHIVLNLIISLPLWTGFMLFGWIMFTKYMLAHLVPNGTPSPLISFMVLIELISNSIRPFTLSIRLMANMVSGHLLLTLMGNSIAFLPFILLLLAILVQSVLSILEMSVAIIQAYVFCMLLILYSDESEY